MAKMDSNFYVFKLKRISVPEKVGEVSRLRWGDGAWSSVSVIFAHKKIVMNSRKRFCLDITGMIVLPGNIIFLKLAYTVGHSLFWFKNITFTWISLERSSLLFN